MQMHSTVMHKLINKLANKQNIVISKQLKNSEKH
jgi:hypothetical protein